MTICVFGLWHLGCVTAGCLATEFPTIGLDPDADVIRSLGEGIAPISEPGLDQLIQAGIASGALSFTTDKLSALRDAEIVWVTFDTPVTDADDADCDFVERHIETLFPYLRKGSIVLVSSQLPVGATARLEGRYRERFPDRVVSFACSPENLRLGTAIQIFRNPGRIVVGIRNAADGEKLSTLLTKFCANLLWMSVESAEMTKHALNAFLANSIAFINEVAAICEQVGADAGQVTQGLKSDDRIGPRAYLNAGGAFAGGTLARDVRFLSQHAKRTGVAVPLLESIQTSNNMHKDWSRNRLKSLFGTLSGKTIAALGLTYKSGTDTLRRSSSIELCIRLAQEGATVRAFDPLVKSLPDGLSPAISIVDSPADAIWGADAVVVATDCPQFRELNWPAMVSGMKNPVIVDPTGYLRDLLRGHQRINYFAVGTGGAA